MIAFARLLAALFLACLVSAQSAAAQSVSNTLERWGLIGTWALDCRKAVSNSNGYLGYVVRGGGRVSHERDFGGGRRDSNQVQRATTGVGGTLELVVHFPRLKQTRKYTMLMGADRRIRAISNSRIDGTQVTIRNGKFTHNGAITPWQTRCR